MRSSNVVNIQAWRSGLIAPIVLLSLVCCACAPLPAKDSAVLRLQDTFPFPPLLDFHGVTVRLVELDHAKTSEYARFHQLSPGRHTAKLKVIKGPTGGGAGRAPLLGTCYGTIEMEVCAGLTYEINFERGQNGPFIVLHELPNDKVLATTPCL